MQVQQKRWKVETYSRLDSVLQLSSVNLPGGVLRRRGIQDELMMRDYFREGDLISVSNYYNIVNSFLSSTIILSVDFDYLYRLKSSKCTAMDLSLSTHEVSSMVK